MSEVDSGISDVGAEALEADEGDGLDESSLPSGLSDVAREALASGDADAALGVKPSKAAKPTKKPEFSNETPDEVGEEDAPAPKRSWKAKANGKEYEVPEDRVQDELQRGFAARQKLEEVAQLRRDLDSQRSELQAQLKRLEESPEEYLRKHQDIAEKVLMERAEEWAKLQQMTPREQELYQARKAAEEKLKSFEAKEQEAQKTQQEQLVAEQRTLLENQFTKALETKAIPKSVLAFRVMAGVVRAAAQKGVDISMEQAAELTRAQLKEVSDASYGSMNAETFISNYPELAEGIRKHYAKKASSGPREVADVRSKPAQRTESGQFKAKSTDSFEDEIRRYKEKHAQENPKGRNLY